MSPILLSCGERYPLKLAGHEGASTQFLMQSGNLLQIILPGISPDEKFAFKRGKIKAGFLYESGTLLWLFRFYDKKGRRLLTFDSPFDARLIPRDIIALHNIENEQQRLAIEIHVIDEMRILRVLRLVTMPNELTLAFLSAVQDQLSTAENQNTMMKWMQSNPDELTGQCKMWELGT